MTDPRTTTELNAPDEQTLAQAEQELRALPAGSQRKLGGGVYMRLDAGGRRRFTYSGVAGIPGGTADSWQAALDAGARVESRLGEGGCMLRRASIHLTWRQPLPSEGGLSIEERIRLQHVRELAWTASERNAEALWARVRQQAEAALYSFWRSGEMKGARHEEAFFVRCERSTINDHGQIAGSYYATPGLDPHLALWTLRAH